MNTIMKKTLAVILFFLLSFTTASAYTQISASASNGQAFSTNLKLGSRGADVKNLQVLLNLDLGTQVL
jgi:hypothetical protein